MDTEFKLHDAPLFDGPAQLPGGHSAATPMQLMQDSTTSRVGSSSAIPEHPTDCPPHADTPDMVTQLPELPSADKGGDSRGCKATHDQHRQAVLYAQPQMEYEAPELDSAEFQMAMELCAALAGQGSPVVASPLPTPPPPPPPACPAPAVATAVTRSGLLQQGIMAPNTFHHPMSTCDHHVLNSFTDLPGDGHVVVTANGHAPGGLSQGMDWLERTDSIFKFASMNMADVAEEVAAELTAGVVPTFEEVMVPVAVMDADGSGDEPCAAAQHASCNFSGHRGAPSGFLQSTGHGSFLVERPPVDAIATITRTAALAKDGGITALPPMAPGSAKTTASTSRDCSNDGSGGSTSGINSDLGGSEGGNADAMEEDDQAQDEDNNGNVTAEPDAVSEGTNTDGEENDDDDEDEPFVIRPHGPYSKRHITKAMLREHFDKPISQAAAALGIGVTVLKKYCRRFKVVRWPYRKLRSMDKLIDSVGEFCSDPSMIQMVLAELLAFRKQILNDPSIDLEARVKKLRQANFKHEYRQRLSDDAADDGTTRRRKRAPPASRQRHADTSAKTHKREKPLHELV